MKRILFILTLILIPVFGLLAQQVIFQKIQGVITDEGTGLPIEGVNILIKNENIETGASTDKNGYFQINEVPVGRYAISISHVGYQFKVERDVLIEASKIKQLEYSIVSSPYELVELTITGSENFADIYQRPGKYPFSVEQSQRFAVTFYDPARMALSFPGVTSANDQANNISIRGNSPFANRWKIEGADMVNPNHLTNAGTFTDRVSVVGGGVSILSAQLLGQSNLFTGAYPSNFGNALGGFMDIHLRKGNNSTREYTMQAGLLGLDFATEGPFSKNSKASYLVNYRYSTIGLLDAIGVEVSPEQINFQDLAFNVSLPTKNGTEWGVFGMLGLSNEKFETEKDTTVWEANEDRINTSFSSNMGALGLTNKIKIGDKSSLNTVLAYSKIRAERNASFVDDAFNPIPIENDLYAQEILSLNSTYNFRLSYRHHFFAGITINNIGYDLISNAAPLPGEEITDIISSKGNYQVFKTFGDWSYVLSPKFQTDIGIHVLYFNLNEEVSVEPRIGIDYLASPRSTFAINYGLVSQSHFPQVYFVKDSLTNELPNEDLQLSKSHQLSLSYNFQINQLTSLRIEGYLLKHYKIPVSSDISSTFSLLNAVDVLINEQLINEGTGENMGAEVMVNRAFKNGAYFILSSSIYDAKYTALDNISRNTLFNGNYSSTFTLGKEIVRIKKEKNKITGFNLRFIWQGGYRHTPIDLSASEMAGKTVYKEEEAFSLKYKDFIRADLRIYLKKNKEKYTRTLSLDIQNLTNQQNIAFEYYDPYTEKVETKYQLGLLPFLTYRVEF